jgi:hypothetical protein
LPIAKNPPSRRVFLLARPLFSRKAVHSIGRRDVHDLLHANVTFPSIHHEEKVVRKDATQLAHKLARRRSHFHAPPHHALGMEEKGLVEVVRIP